MNKEDKKLLKRIRRMGEGDELQLHGYDLVCVGEQFYLLIHPSYGISEKHYDEIEDWVISGGVVG